MASTYNFIDGSISGQIIPPETTLEENSTVVRRNIVDFSQQTLEAGASDVGKVITIPANTTVLTAWIRVMTAETTNATCDLGYGGDVDEWGDAVALDTADAVVGGTFSPIFFADADTIDIVATVDTADIDLDAGKIEVCALMYKHVDNY